MRAMVEGFPDFASGSDAYLLDVLRIGGAGSITACNNIAARQSAAVLTNWQKDDGYVSGSTQRHSPCHPHPPSKH